MKFVKSLSLILILLLPNTIFSSEKLNLYVFHSPDCESCQYVKDNILPGIDEKYNGQLEYTWIDIDQYNNLEQVLVKVEEYFRKPEGETPIFVFADTILSSKEEIEPNLDKLIEQKIGEKKFGITDPVLRDILNNRDKPVSGEKQEVSGKSVSILYFNNPKCPKCSRVEKCLAYLTRKFPQVKVKHFSDKESNNLAVLQALDEIYQVDENRHLVTPAVFVGDSAFIGDDAKDKRIINAVKQYIKTGTGDKLEEAREKAKDASSEIIERFNKFGIFAIIFAGLLDGINPCAFTTIIFFISYLSFLGRNKKEIIITGTSYSLAVFLTYFLIGLGVLEFLIYLQIFSLISRVFIGVTGVLAVVLSAISIFNYFKVKKGEENKIALQLPAKIKKRIHSTIREYSKARHLVVGAFVTGFFVSIFELACTGQVYLPTITFMVHHPSYKMKATFLLFLYNFMFIVPLIIIFLLAYKGLTSDQLAKAWRKELDLIELGIAVLFLVLGGFLIYSVL